MSFICPLELGDHKIWLNNQEMYKWYPPLIGSRISLCVGRLLKAEGIDK